MFKLGVNKSWFCFVSPAAVSRRRGGGLGWRLPAYNTLGTDPPHPVETILRGHAGVDEDAFGEEEEQGKKSNNRGSDGDGTAAGSFSCRLGPRLI